MPSIDNKKKTQQNKILYIFLTAFFVSLIFIIYLATAFTPDIDVDIESGKSASDTDRQEIDDRLRDLQQDELTSDTNAGESSSEIIEQLKRLKEDALEKQQKNDEITIEDDNTAPETPKLNPANPEYRPQKDALPKTAKIYVGRYSTFEEALKVQDALIQSSLVSSPFIKNVGSYYVIQVGSYSNQQTAQNIAEGLIEHGYSARMILE